MGGGLLGSGNVIEKITRKFKRSRSRQLREVRGNELHSFSCHRQLPFSVAVQSEDRNPINGDVTLAEVESNFINVTPAPLLQGRLTIRLLRVHPDSFSSFG